MVLFATRGFAPCVHLLFDQTPFLCTRFGIAFLFGRAGDDLLVKGGDMHMKTPTYTGQYVRASDVPSGQAIDGGLLMAIHNLADAPFYIHAI